MEAVARLWTACFGTVVWTITKLGEKTYRIEEVHAKNWMHLIDPLLLEGNDPRSDPVQPSKGLFADFRIREIHIPASELALALARLLSAEPGPFHSRDAVILDGDTYGFDLGPGCGKYVTWSDSYDGADEFRAAFAEVVAILRDNGACGDAERDGMNI